MHAFYTFYYADYNFAVNCGGGQFTSANRIVYERDNETLGPATYYVSNSKRWAVSSVGYFTGIANPRYAIFSSYQFTNTLDSELFQTSRLSASSLRYYGLGLGNGEYTVNLQFSETGFEDSSTWKNIGRRVFDVYIQVSSVFLLVYMFYCLATQAFQFPLISVDHILNETSVFSLPPIFS